jgi:hypothetical protein
LQIRGMPPQIAACAASIYLVTAMKTNLQNLTHTTFNSHWFSRPWVEKPWRKPAPQKPPQMNPASRPQNRKKQTKVTTPL